MKIYIFPRMKKYQKENLKEIMKTMNNTMTLYLSSRLDRLSLEKDEPISSLNSKISTERDVQLIPNYKNLQST